MAPLNLPKLSPSTHHGLQSHRDNEANITFVRVFKALALMSRTKESCRAHAALSKALAILLERWTLCRAIGAKYATIAPLGFNPCSAPLTNIEELARVAWHSLYSGMAADRAGNGRF
jgi:hypothetical protein